MERPLKGGFGKKPGYPKGQSPFYINLWFNSKSPDHFAAKCDQPRTADVAARRALRDVRSARAVKKAAINVLSQFGLLESEEETESSDSASTENSAGAGGEDDEAGTKYCEVREAHARSEDTPMFSYDISATNGDYCAILTRYLTHQVFSDYSEDATGSTEVLNRRELIYGTESSSVGPIREVLKTFVNYTEK